MATASAKSARGQRYTYGGEMVIPEIASNRSGTTVTPTDLVHPTDSLYPESQSIAFEDASDPVVTIVVLGWRDAPHLLDCLRAVSMTDRSVTFEVIVTLNEPLDRLVNDLKEHVT